MALYTVSTGQTIQAQDVDQLVNVLQQPGSSQEKGKYMLEGNAYVSGAYFSLYMPSLSRNTSPVSVSIDTADNAPTALLNAPSTDHLTANGFHIFSNTTGISSNQFCAGNYTIQYALFLLLTPLAILATLLGHMSHLL